VKSSDYHTHAHQYHNGKISSNIALRYTFLLAIAVLLIACSSIVGGSDGGNSIDHNADAQIATTTTTTRSLLLKPTTLISESKNDDYLAHVSLEKALPANPPTANAIVSPNQTIRQGTENVTLDGSKSYDPNGNITLYSWQQIAGPHVKLNSTSTPAVKFNTTCDTLGTELKFKLIVTDNNGLSDSTLVNVKVGYSAMPAICKEAIFSPIPLPLSFTTGKSYTFRVNFGTQFKSIDKVAAISNFDPTDPFGLGDAFSIANFGTGYHYYLGGSGSNNNNSSSNSNGSSRNNTAVKEGFAIRAPNNNNNDNDNATVTILTKKDANTANRLLQGNFTSNYSSIKGSFTLTSLKFCVKGAPKIGNESSNNNNSNNNNISISNILKPVSFTVIMPTKVAKSTALSKLSTNSENTTTTNLSVTFDPECNIVTSTPTISNATALATITADDKNTKTPTNTTNKVNSDLATGNGSRIGATQNQQQPLLQQGPPYQTSSPLLSPPPSISPSAPPPLSPSPYTNPYLGPYPYSGTPNQYQQPYPYPYPSPAYPYPYPAPNPFPYPYPANQPPIANAGPNQVVNQGAFVRLDGTGSYDPDGGTITSYRWQQILGSPVVTLSGANTATPTFIAPTTLTDTTLTFQLTVTDSDGGASSSNTVNVLIQRNNTNQAPIANAGPNQVVNQLSLVSLDGTSSYDPNGATIEAYSWVQTAGVPVLLNGAGTATPTFTAPIVSSDTILAFSLKVMNNNGIISNNPAIVYITVKRNL
jgi:PKD domain